MSVQLQAILILAGTVVLLLVIGAWLGSIKVKRLRAAPSGSVSIETVKASRVNGTLRQYGEAGWTITSQSSAKSFGTQPRVALSFQKP